MSSTDPGFLAERISATFRCLFDQPVVATKSGKSAPLQFDDIARGWTRRMLSISWIALSMVLIPSFVPVSGCECRIDRIARLASGRNTKGTAFLATALAFVLAVLTIP